MSSDERHPLRSNQDDLESAGDQPNRSSAHSGASAIKDLFKQLDRGFSGRRHSFKDPSHSHSRSSSVDHHFVDGRDVLADGAPPEWALLLIGCLIGLAAGLCVALFNYGVSFYLMCLSFKRNFL